jgi:uncharacterized membrane protein
MKFLYLNKSKLLLAFFLLFGFVLRNHSIDKFGIAGDEKYSLFVSQFTSYQGNNQKNSVRKPNSDYFTAKEFWSEKGIEGFYDAIARVDTGNGAFFTYGLHWWTKFFGLSDKSLRFLPLLFSLGIVLLIYFFVKEHFENENLALITAGFSAISPLLISYAQIARNYALLFFFALLATHYFLKLLTTVFNSKKWWLYLIIYGITAAICELNHLSTFPLFFIHFIFLFIYHRTWKNFWSFSIAMIFPFIAIVAWVLSPGGAYILEYVSNSVRVYNEMAASSPYEFLSKTSFVTVILQIRHVLAAYFINFDGTYDLITGKKNGVVGITFTCIGALVYSIKKLNSTLKLAIGLFLFAAAILLTKSGAIASITLGLHLLFFSKGLFSLLKDFKKKPILHFILLLTVIPLIFLVLYAIQDDNTFRIVTRYVGYSYAFALILVLLVYWNLFSQLEDYTPWLYVACAMQVGIISMNVFHIYEDTQPRYYSDYPEPRIQNPYPQIANKIINLAMPGDTIVYPSDALIHDDRIQEKSVLDAQLVNFYLPKTNEIPQRVDAIENDKVYLIKIDGSKIELFDFKGTKYRF